MKRHFAITSSLCLAALLSALLSAQAQAQAQTPAPTQPNPSTAKPTPKTADQRAAAYKGPKVVKDTKALGTKMIRDSKPDTQSLGKPSPK
jgi:hypothetical protein